MDRAVGFLAKAVTAAAVLALVLAVVVMVDSRSLFGLPLLVLAAVAGSYSLRLARAERLSATEAPELRQRILVS
jgi:hypothetical protein